MKPTHSLHDVEEERVVPWGARDQYAWHEARYRFARRFAEGKRVLDVGSGEGYGVALLSDAVAHVTGVDYSPAALEHARAKYSRPNVDFIQGDVRDLPVEEASYDLVTCFEVLEHIDDHKAMLRSICAALRPGGALLLSSPNAELERLHERATGRDHYEYHTNVLTTRQLKEELERAFEEVELYGQYARGNRVRFLLKLVDRWNLRHRLVRSNRMQVALSENVMGTPGSEAIDPDDLSFSRLMTKQSAIILAVARSPRR